MTTIIEYTYNEGGHSNRLGGNKARYQNETLRGRKKVKMRKYWRDEAIKLFSKNQNIKGISYNEKCHSVYLHSKIDPAKWRNKNNPTFKGKPSNRHENHTLVIFNR